MAVVMTDTPVNVGTSSVQVLAQNSARKALQIQNKHATQTVRVKFGAAVVSTDVTAVQKITFSNVPTSGSFVLNWNGNASAAILFSGAASDVQTALQAVTGLGSVTVTGTFTAGFVVTMTSASPAVLAALPLLTVTANSLAISPVATVVTVVTTTIGQYADGILIAANSTLSYSTGSCPIGSVFALASGTNTRLEIFEGN